MRVINVLSVNSAFCRTHASIVNKYRPDGQLLRCPAMDSEGVMHDRTDDVGKLKPYRKVTSETEICDNSL